jgi:hypothetical protein
VDRGSHGAVIAFNEAINRPDLQALDGPAIWTAKTSDGKVSEWRVYEDTKANRQRLGI